MIIKIEVTNNRTDSVIEYSNKVDNIWGLTWDSDEFRVTIKQRTGSNKKHTIARLLDYSITQIFRDKD